LDLEENSVNSNIGDFRSLMSSCCW
jgi:hypothetical protein